MQREFRIIPVLDILNGEVVRAYRGQRERYRPWRNSIWDNSANPQLWVAKLSSRFPGACVYVADLNALLGGERQWSILRAFSDFEIALWYEGGMRGAADVKAALNRLGSLRAPLHKVVIGLETWSHPDDIIHLVQDVGAERLVFSLDLLGGRPMGCPCWPKHPVEIIRRIEQAGIRDVIVLDLDKVGTQAGNWAMPLTGELIEAAPSVRFYPGGGVRGPADVLQIKDCCCAGLLVGTALHTGQLAELLPHASPNLVLSSS